jgi:hypothetical protein
VQRLRCGGLPPLHPDLSIRAQKGPCVGVLKGLAFGMLKRLLRTAATGTVVAVRDAIGGPLNSFQSDECANYLRHCGYAHSGR